MEHNKAPGPDGFPIVFYQEYWHIIGLDRSNGKWLEESEDGCPDGKWLEESGDG